MRCKETGSALSRGGNTFSCFQLYVVLFGNLRYNFFVMTARKRYHRRTRAILAMPVIFFFFLSGSAANSTANLFFLNITPTIFPASGESITVTLLLDTRLPSNAVGGVLVYDPQTLEARAISLDGSIVDIWAGDPMFNNSNGTLKFNGGFLDANGYIGRGAILSVEFVAKAAGVSRIGIQHPQILANDGVGTNRALETFTYSSRVFVHDEKHPSVDQNGDGRLSLSDAQTVFFATFRAYDARRDVTGDGKVSWSDVAALLSLIND